MIIVNGWKPLTIITKRCILDVAAVLDPPLVILSYLKLPFELSMSFTTALAQTNTHHGMFYQSFPGRRWLFLEGCKVPTVIQNIDPGLSVCLNHTVLGKHMISKKLYLKCHYILINYFWGRVKLKNLDRFQCFVS